MDTIDRQRCTVNEELELVSALIESSSRKWKAKSRLLLKVPEEIAQRILQIPLAETSHADSQVWKGEQSGEFSVRSAYKLLQDSSLDPSSILLQTESKKFYSKLWSLQLPTKIAITVWRASWNYLPTLINLRSKRVITNVCCIRCGLGDEDCSHTFRHCPGYSSREQRSRVDFFVMSYG